MPSVCHIFSFFSEYQRRVLHVLLDLRHLLQTHTNSTASDIDTIQRIDSREEAQVLEDELATPSVFKEMTEMCARRWPCCEGYGFRAIVQLYDKEFNVPVQHAWSVGQSSF